MSCPDVMGDNGRQDMQGDNNNVCTMPVNHRCHYLRESELLCNSIENMRDHVLRMQVLVERIDRHQASDAAMLNRRLDQVESLIVTMTGMLRDVKESLENYRVSQPQETPHH